MAVKDKGEEAEVIRKTLHTPRQDWHLWKERGKEEGSGERDSHCSRDVRMSRRGHWGILKPVHLLCKSLHQREVGLNLYPPHVQSLLGETWGNLYGGKFRRESSGTIINYVSRSRRTEYPSFPGAAWATSGVGHKGGDCDPGETEISFKCVCNILLLKLGGEDIDVHYTILFNLGGGVRWGRKNGTLRSWYTECSFPENLLWYEVQQQD